MRMRGRRGAGRGRWRMRETREIHHRGHREVYGGGWGAASLAGVVRPREARRGC